MGLLHISTNKVMPGKPCEFCRARVHETLVIKVHKHQSIKAAGGNMIRCVEELTVFLCTEVYGYIA